MMKLEICCYSIEDVLIAQQNGADRIEFCAGRSDGGLTASYGDLYQLSQLLLPIPIHPIIRPRGGDFCYSQYEINTMINDIKLLRDLNFTGVVFGCLHTDGHIDLKNMTKLIHAADGLSITFHRAFDVCINPLLSLQQINDLGINRLLTSGQQATAVDGIQLISQLTQNSTSTIIMPGCGLRSSNIQQFKQLGLTEFHSSASKTIASPMIYKNQNVSMSNSQKDEFLRYCADGDEIFKMKQFII